MTPPKRHRRTHSPEFKAMLIAQCRVPGISVAAVAMTHQINANLLRVWIRKAEGELLIVSPSRLVPVQLAAPAIGAAPICIYLQGGDTQIQVEWPMASAALCREWLQDWLR